MTMTAASTTPTSSMTVTSAPLPFLHAEFQPSISSAIDTQQLSGWQPQQGGQCRGAIAATAMFSPASSSATTSNLATSNLYSLPVSPKRPPPVSSSKSPNITKSQMKEFREAFNLFDKDGDGSITKEELGRVMRSLGQFARAEELHTMMQDIDID
ncbi:uncharacterized protein LOC144478203, partial [Augochlora pura]